MHHPIISDSWQAVEIEWQAATTPGANNGTMKLFVNDVLVDDIQNLDTDARSITEARLGVEGIPTGTTGTVYFDAFDSNRSNHIGLAPNGPTLTGPLTDLIFTDGFESADLSSWDVVNTGGGDLSVSSTSVKFGSYGLQALINDTTNLSVKDDTPTPETHYSARFYFDPNSISMPNGSGMFIFTADADPYGWAFCLQLKRSAGSYLLSACVLDDTDTWHYGSNIPISDDWQAVEMEWQTASAPGANNGYLKLWINDVLVDTLANLDSDTLAITDVSLGAVESIDAGTSGSLYFDAFESRTGAHIGTLAQAPAGNAPILALANPAPQNGVFQPVSYHPSGISAPVLSNVSLPNLPLQQSTATTINYVYDPLQRLKEANYSNNDYYHYTYDAVGNRLTQNTMLGGLPLTTNYVYDNANRLNTVNGVNYTFDANGNLLNDGTNVYVYDSANRLKSMTGASTANFSYNGLGDRLTQNSVHYTLDLNAGLTQVLADGTSTYTYGLGRISQTNTVTEYFLGDALGSCPPIDECKWCNHLCQGL